MSKIHHANDVAETTEDNQVSKSIHEDQDDRGSTSMNNDDEPPLAPEVDQQSPRTERNEETHENLNVDENYLNHLEDELKQQQDQVSRVREQVKFARQERLQSKLRSLESKEVGLEADFHDNRTKRITLRSTLAAKKERQKHNVLEHLRMREETWALEREHALEEAAQRRIRQQDLAISRQNIESMLDSHVLQLDEIKAEKRRRGQTQVEVLERLLARGDVLAQELANCEEIDPTVVAEALTTTDEQDSISGSKSTYRLVDEIESIRRRTFEEKAFAREERNHQLNLDRRALLKAEAALRTQKQQHVMLLAKGNDFITDIELGHAPPRAYVIQNLQLQENSLPLLDVEEEEEENIDELLTKAKANVATQDQMLDQLRLELDEIERDKHTLALPPSQYDGSLGFAHYRKNQHPAYFLSQGLVQELVEQVIELAHVRTQELARVLQEERVWRHNEEHFVTDSQAKQEHVAIRGILRELLHDVMTDMWVDIWNELEDVRQLVGTFVVQALSQLFLPPISKPAATEVFHSMFLRTLEQLQRTRKESQASLEVIQPHVMSQFVLTQQHVNMLAPASSESKTTKHHKKPKISPEILPFVDPTEPTAAELDEISNHFLKQATQVVFHQVEEHQEDSHHHEASVRRERAYWKTLQVVPRTFTISPKVSNVTNVSLSPNGQFLAASSASGKVFIYDLGHHPKSTGTSQGPTILRNATALPPSLQTLVLVLEWDIHSTFVLALYEAGPVVLWSTLPERGSWGSTPGHSSSSHTAPTSLSLDTSIAPARLTRPKFLKKERGQTLEISRGCFALGFSFLGHQHSSVLLGMTDGMIVKWNHKRAEVVPVVGSGVMPYEVPDEEDVWTETAQASLRTFECPSPHIVQREFFQFHRAKIAYVGICRVIPEIEILSVSEDGWICLWTYVSENVSGFGWHEPTARYQLALEVPDRPFGKLSQVRLSKDWKKLVLMIVYFNPKDAQKKRFVRVYHFNLIDETLASSRSFTRLELNSSWFELEFVGQSRPQFQLSRVFPGLDSEVVFVLMNNAVYIFSLVTGTLLAFPRKLTPKNQKEHPITALDVGGLDKCTFVAAGALHPRIYCIDYVDPSMVADPSDVNPEDSKVRSPWSSWKLRKPNPFGPR